MHNIVQRLQYFAVQASVSPLACPTVGMVGVTTCEARSPPLGGLAASSGR